jgi:hypothetical protein
MVFMFMERGQGRNRITTWWVHACCWVAAYVSKILCAQRCLYHHLIVRPGQESD